MPKTSVLEIRYALRRDIPVVAALGPWGEDDLLARLRSGGRTSCLVADLDGAVVGHALFDWLPDHLVLRAVAVSPGHRLRGVGTLLVDAVRDRLNGRRWMDCVVPEDRLTALQFLRANGFRAVHVLRKWFDDLDGYQMELRQP